MRILQFLHTNYIHTLNYKRAFMTQTLSLVNLSLDTTWATEPGATEIMLLALPGCAAHCTAHTFISTAVLLLCPGRCSSCSSVGIKPSKLLFTATAPAQQRSLIGLHSGKMLSRIFFVDWSINLLRSTQGRVRSACFHPSRAQKNYHSWN